MYQLKQNAGSQTDLLFLESCKDYILINLSSPTYTQESRSRPSSPVNGQINGLQHKPCSPQLQHIQVMNAAIHPLKLKPTSNHSVGKIQSNLSTVSKVKIALKPDIQLSEKLVQEEIEADLIRKVAASAKYSEWNDVWGILDKNPGLINCIPNERAWAVLHHAVWYDNTNAVRKILSYPTCDPQIRKKLDRTNDSGVGMKPIELAKSQEVKAILKAADGKKIGNVEAPTMLTVKKIGNSLGSCIHKTLSCNQGVLIPLKWCSQQEQTIHTIPDLMKTIFDFVNTGDNWVNTRNKISLTVQQFSKPLGDNLWKGAAKICDTKQNFYRRVIQLYTEERDKVYKEMNKMLRLQYNGKEGYQPDGMQLSLCPCSLLLNSILMGWSEMSRYTGRTYRVCKLTKEQANQYVIGQQFVWLSFSSSSKEEIKHGLDAHLFVIDNSVYSEKWSPREIKKYSKFTSENECLYPFGAQFEVTDVKKKQISLRLIDY